MIPLFVLVPDFTYKFIKTNFNPSPVEYLINNSNPNKKLNDSSKMPNESCRKIYYEDSKGAKIIQFIIKNFQIFFNLLITFYKS